MFNDSFLRVCRILRFVKKLDFTFLSLGGPSHGARVWCLVRVPKHRNQWQELVGLLFSPQNIHLFQQLRLPSIPSPVEKDTSKIRDTTGTVFIQGPSILLLVWRSIMFNCSFLRLCRILRFMKKIDFPIVSLGVPRHGARVWCLSRGPKHRNHWQEVEGSGKK